MADGSRHSLYLIDEGATYGVTPATPAYETIRLNGTTLGLAKNTLQSEEIRADRQIADFRHGTFQVGGEINSELSYSTFDAIMEAVMMGTWAADTPIAGTDQLKAGITRRSFSGLRYFADIAGIDRPYHPFRGIEFNTIALTVAADAIVTANFGVIGQIMDATSATAPAGATFNAPSATAPMDSFTGVINEGGVQIAVVTEITLNLDNAIQPRYVVGSKSTIRPSTGRSNLTGQVTAFFENSDLLDKFINETESSIDFTLVDDAGNEYLFTLPRVKYNGGQPDVQGEGPITLAMPFQALRDPTEGSQLVIERTPI